MLRSKWRCTSCGAEIYRIVYPPGGSHCSGEWELLPLKPGGLLSHASGWCDIAPEVLGGADTIEEEWNECSEALEVY